MQKRSHADVALIRQRTQFTCCAASIASALHALGKKYSEDDVNMILEAGPMRGASWEAMLATVQYFGCRGSLVVPSTPRMLKDWTDAGKPVVIAWNPESRPWSHASTVFKVTEDDFGKLWVHVMDPNIPNPGETVRVLDEDKFSALWAEKVSENLIMRRPAMVITEEVDLGGRQVVASTKTAGDREVTQVGSLNAYWEYNSRLERVYGISDRSIEGNPIVGQIVWNRNSNTWTVEQWLDTAQERKRSLGSLTASDAREGVKLSLMLFQEKHTKVVMASSIPIPRPIQAPPHLFKNSLEDWWADLLETIIKEARTDGGNDKVKLMMAVWDAGYQAGHVRAQSPSHDYMVEGSKILGLMKHLGRLQEGIEEWTNGYTEGLKESTP